MTDKPKKKYPKRGFASMSPEQRREISSKGGSASPMNFKRNPQRAAELARRSTKTEKDE